MSTLADICPAMQTRTARSALIAPAAVRRDKTRSSVIREGLATCDAAHGLSATRLRAHHGSQPGHRRIVRVAVFVVCVGLVALLGRAAQGSHPGNV